MKPVLRHARWPLHLLRASAALVLLDILLQAALAGLFVTGDLDVLAWHAANAELLGALAVLQALAALLVRRVRRGSAWPVVAAVLLVVAVGAQQALGEARALAAHIPLGMTLFGCAAVLAFWAFGDRAVHPGTGTSR